MPLISITVPNNETSGLPLRGLAMILAAVAILLAGWGVYSATRDDPSEPEQTTDTPVAADTTILHNGFGRCDCARPRIE